MSVAPEQAVHDDAREVWDLLAVQMAGIAPRLAGKVWKALSRHPGSLSLRYAMVRAVSAGPPNSPARQQAAQALGHGAGRPQALLPLIEDCVRWGQLTRAEATAVEEKLLAQVRKGQWK